MNRFATLLLSALFALNAWAEGAGGAGEVTKVDKAAARLTIKHNGIKQFDMPPMVMGFKVREPGLLEGLAPGDRVRFTVERIDGQYTLTALSKAPA